jgi:hypothetical protein
MRASSRTAEAAAAAPPGALEILDSKTCFELVADESVGRLAWSTPGRVHVFPMTYAVEHGSVLLCTSSGSVMQAVTAGTRLGFQVDNLEPALRTGWTVLIEGPGEAVTKEADIARARALVAPWPGLNDPEVIRIRPEHVTGRRIRERPGAICETFVSDDETSVQEPGAVSADGWPIPMEDKLCLQ